MSHVTSTDSISADFVPPDFSWPEPLVIDAIGVCYDQADDWAVAARAHAAYLRELVDGDARRSAALRLEVIACCAARGIAAQTIEAADRAALRELSGIVQARFRNSPRARLHHVRRLRAALDRLPANADVTAAAATVSRLGASTGCREPMRLS